MAIFLQEPRYQFGCLGFYTEPAWGRRIVIAGAVISVIGLLAAVGSGLMVSWSGRAAESIFLIGAAWILVFGLMRIFWTGAMWVFSHVFDAISEGIPSLATPMYFLRRAYWIFIESFLSVSLIAILAAAILIAFGALSISEEEQAEQGAAGQPATTPRVGD
jgi:hypothetical protein